MGVLANHVPSIEQLKPGLVEIIEESGGSKQFFCMSVAAPHSHGAHCHCFMDTLVANLCTVGSVGGLCYCAAKLAAQYQCR